MAFKFKDMTSAVKMKFNELKEIVTRAAREARKRADRIFKSKTINASESPAIRRAQESRPRGQVSLFESRGKNRNELLAEYKRIKYFMEDQTSTVAGTKDFYKNIAKHLSDRTDGDEISGEETVKIFKALDRLKKENPWVENSMFKYDVIQAISSEIQADPNRSLDEIVANTENMLDDVYINVLDNYRTDMGNNDAGYMDVGEIKEDWEDLI